MERQLKELGDLSKLHDAPVIYGGDVFNSWDNPSELVNFALANLPKGYAVPGQHDLKHHRIEDIKRTSFWTLVESGRLTLLDIDNPIEHGIAEKSIRIWGFPWNRKVIPLQKKGYLGLDIAVIHAYIWTDKTGYPGAPEKQRLGEWVKILQGYDVVLFGDNHTTLTYNSNRGKEDVVIFNPGSFYRRRSDEVNHRPLVGLLHSNGTVERHYLKSSEDKFIDTADKVKVMEGHIGIGLTSFLDELSGLSDKSLDFLESCNRYLQSRRLEHDVKECILDCIDHGE